MFFSKENFESIVEGLSSCKINLPSDVNTLVLSVMNQIESNETNKDIEYLNRTAIKKILESLTKSESTTNDYVSSLDNFVGENTRLDQSVESTTQEMEKKFAIHLKEFESAKQNTTNTPNGNESSFFNNAKFEDNERLAQMGEFRQSNKPTDETMREIFSDALEASNIQPMDAITTENLLPENYVIPKNDENSITKLVINNIEISSLDRYFSCKPGINENNFKFSISLLRNNDEWKRYPNMPIYSNSPFMSYSETLLVDENWTEGRLGLEATDYVLDEPLGTIDSWDALKVSKTFNMLSVNELNKIKSISIKSVLLYQNRNGTKNAPNLLKYPYLLLKINEIGNVYSSTNEALSQSCAKLVFDKNSGSEMDNTSHLLYKTYKPEIISAENFNTSSLSRLSFEILSPNGKQISTLKDTFLVKFIKRCDSTGNEDATGGYLKIVLNEYTESSQFLANHNIVFENVTVSSQLPDYINRSELLKFLDFINNESGHQITYVNTTHDDNEVKETNGIILIKTFVIEMEKTITYETGIVNYASYDNITWVGLNSLATFEIPLGSVTNTTIQSSISMVFEIESV